MRKKQPWLMLSTVLLGASLLANVVLLRSLRHQYAQTYVAQVWPMGSPAAIPVPKADQPLTNLLLLLGDSRVADWALPEMPGWRVANAGQPGATTAQVSFHSRALLERTRPALVVIQLGINDLKLAGPRPDLREALVNNCVSNIDMIVRECHRAGAEVLVTTVWPVGEISLLRQLVWSSAVDAAVAETNDRLKKYFAHQPGVRVSDLFATLAQDPAQLRRSEWHRDTLHLKPEAYVRLSAALVKTLAAPTNQGSFLVPLAR